MRRLLGAGLILATLVLSALAGQSQAPPPGGGKSGQGPTGEPAKAPSQDLVAKRIPLEKLKVPPGAVLILCDELKDGLKLFPRMILLTPEKFQEMTERISQLERQLKPDRPVPAECRLKATVEGDFVQLQADFVFTTRQPKTSVQLGCRGAQLTDARLKSGEGEGDGRLPLLEPPGPAGYAIFIEKAGDYQLTMNLKLPVAFAAGAASRGAERSFELGLPGAAVTTLTVELGQPVREIRWNKSVERARPVGGKQKRFEDVPLGGITNLVLSWQEPIAVPEAGPLLTAKGQVTVKLEEQQVQTTAELTLTDLRGKAKEWRLWLPWQARVKVTPPERITCKVVSPAGSHLHTLQLSEPTTDAVKVTVTVRHSRPTGQRFPVGPFAVVDAFRQEGTIEVRASPTARRGVRLQYVLGGEADERDPPRDHATDVVAFFRYWNMAVPPKTVASPIGKIPPPGTGPLEIEIKAARGQVETSLEHRLRVKPLDAGPGGGLQVLVTTKIHVRPLGDPVDYLDVQLPRAHPDAVVALVRPNPTAFPDAVAWAALALSALAPHDGEWQAEGAELHFPDEKSRKQRRARIRLLSPKESTVVLTGAYLLPPGTRRVRLDLPRPVVVKEGRAKIRLEADDSLELLTQELGPELPAPGRHQHTYETDVAPASVELAWRPYRPELPVALVADVTFHERDAHVRQELTFEFPERQGAGALAANIQRLSVPAAVQGLQTEARCRWQLLGHDPVKGLAWARPPVGATREPLVLEYQFALPPVRAAGRDADEGRKKNKGKKDADGAEARPFETPLLWPEQATRVRSKVRLWSALGTLPSLAGAEPAETSWRDRGTEVVPGRGLPAGVLTADGVRPPLLLRLERSPALLAGVVVDRALVQVTVDQDGSEHYRARFVLSKVNAAGLDVRLPAPAALVSLAINVNGLKASPRPRQGGEVMHVPLDSTLTGRPVTLEILYQLPRKAEGLWQTVLHAPEIVGNVFLGRVRWQVTMPDAWVPVAAGADAHTEQGWGWHGWLPAPAPAVSAAQLEQWLTGKEGRDDALPSLVCSRTSLEPLRLLRMPRQAWFLACSGVLLVVGLGLSLAPLSHYSFWVTVALLGLGVVVAGVLWPSVLPAVLYGCEPGALVLAVLLAVQWMLHQRYRRQVVFMPGFKRLKPGSSLVRGGRHREPTTVDAPSAPAVTGGQGSSLAKGN